MMTMTKKKKKSKKEIDAPESLYHCNFCGKYSTRMNICQECQDYLDRINGNPETYRHYQ